MQSNFSNAHIFSIFEAHEIHIVSGAHKKQRVFNNFKYGLTYFSSMKNYFSLSSKNIISETHKKKGVISSDSAFCSSSKLCSITLRKFSEYYQEHISEQG